jgi:hypothetical protein
MEILNTCPEWIPGCWCAATIQLCERGSLIEDGGRSRHPAQWAYFVWTPRDNALPHAVPNGWGVLLHSPEPDLADIIDGAPVYFLQEFEADWPTLLDILLSCEPSPPWLEERILQLREKAAVRRREHWAWLYGDNRPAFEAFMRRLLPDTAYNLKER